MSPGLALLLLASILGELVSGHQGPFEFINPIAWVLTAMPYGLGALACRELVVRWGKGWWSLFLLSMAYGVFEEAIVARSIFDPKWSELGALAQYNHYAGINWTFSEVLIHFHITISILASVTLVEMFYPARKHDSWISTRQLGLCFVGLLLWIPAIMGAQSASPDPEIEFYFPPVGLYLLGWAVIFGLMALARIIPKEPLPARDRPVPRPLYFGLLGAVNMTVFFLTVFTIPEMDSPPPLLASVVFLLVLDLVTLGLILHWSGNGFAWTDNHVFALIVGQLSFFIVFGFLQDLDEGFQGKSLTSIVTVYALWRLWRYFSEHSAREVGEPASMSS